MIHNRKPGVSLLLRASALLVVMVYMMLSVGVLKATHFCMGREASVVYFSADARNCACDAFETEKDSCCDETQELLRIEDEQKVFTTISIPAPVWQLERVIENQLVLRAETLQDEREIDPMRLSPALVPLWKSHCALVLYDDEHVG